MQTPILHAFGKVTYFYSLGRLYETKQNKTKLAWLCFASLLSSTAFATSNFTGSSGILVIPDVNVNGTAVYDSVTLQLDLAKGTFSVVNAKLKDSKVSSTPLDTLSTEGFDIGFLGCATSGTNEITCYLNVVNNELDRPLRLFGNYSIYSSMLYDDLNNAYTADSVKFANASGGSDVSPTLIQGVPTKASILFKNINIRAKSISAFKPYFRKQSPSKDFVGNFRNINF
ncbi:MAG: hypothetical protein ABL903_11015 [Methylococcales bacterium]